MLRRLWPRCSPSVGAVVSAAVVATRLEAVGPAMGLQRSSAVVGAGVGEGGEGGEV